MPKFTADAKIHGFRKFLNYAKRKQSTRFSVPAAEENWRSVINYNHWSQLDCIYVICQSDCSEIMSYENARGFRKPRAHVLHLQNYTLLLWESNSVLAALYTPLQFTYLLFLLFFYLILLFLLFLFIKFPTSSFVLFLAI